MQPTALGRREGLARCPSLRTEVCIDDTRDISPDELLRQWLALGTVSIRGRKLSSGKSSNRRRYLRLVTLNLRRWRWELALVRIFQGHPPIQVDAALALAYLRALLHNPSSTIESSLHNRNISPTRLLQLPPQSAIGPQSSARTSSPPLAARSFSM
jgi:hypothetical protein